MIAQKLKNNKIAIGNSTPRKDAIEVIEDLKTSEFCRLFKAAREWNKSINDNRDIVFTHYENEDSKICKEFNKILLRRKLFEEKLKIIENEFNSTVGYKAVKKENPPIVWASKIKGTSRLLRIPKNQIIKIVRRKGLIDDNNRFNSVCIDNRLREEFFADCKKSYNFQNMQETTRYEIENIEEDKNLYEKWDAIITKIYEEGLPKN